MKKILMILLSLLLLCACSNGHDTKISDGDEVIFVSSNNKAYTKADLYSDMMLNDISSYLTNDLITKLAKLEGVDFEVIQKEIDDEITEAIEAGQESFINYYYGSTDNYIKQMIPYKALLELKKAYVLENIYLYVDDYQPFKAQIASFKDLETAEKVAKDLESGKELPEAAALNGYSEDVTTNLYFVSYNDLPIEVYDYISKGQLGQSEMITVTTSSIDEDGNDVENNEYYFVNFVSRDVEEFKDEFVDAIANNVDQTVVISNLLTKYEINIYDQRAYDLLTSTYEVLK